MRGRGEGGRAAVNGERMRELTLKYGCNPDQGEARADAPNGLPFIVRNGSPGYINLLDALNAWQLVRELRAACGLPAAASFKHVSPAGAALGLPLDEVDKRVYFVAPGTALNEVERICEEIDESVTITLGQRHILFEVGETELICRRLEGEFLDYKNAIPRRNPINLVLDTKTMLQSLERVSVVISEKLKSPVRCLFDHDKVLLSAKTGNGEAKDICRLSGDGGGLEIGFNNRYLMDALRYAPADTVKMELNTGISPAIIVPVDGEENFLYMVLPVRLKAN